MGAKIVAASDGLLTLKISGKLTAAELADIQTAADAIFRVKGKMGVLVLAQDFLGWERGADWGDSPCQTERDSHVARMAIVGDPRWEDLASMFTAKGLRSFPIEYYAPSKVTEAVAWLSGK